MTNTNKTFNVDQIYCTEGVDWLEVIQVNDSQIVQDYVNQAIRIKEDNPNIRSVDFDVPDDFITRQSLEELNEECSFSYSKLSVHGKYGVYLTIEGNHTDATAEYDLSHLYYNK